MSPPVRISLPRAIRELCLEGVTFGRRGLRHPPGDGIDPQHGGAKQEYRADPGQDRRDHADRDAHAELGSGTMRRRIPVESCHTMYSPESTVIVAANISRPK